MPENNNPNPEGGWFWPSGAKKAHFDPGNPGGVAHCGRWGRYNPYSGTWAPLDDVPDAPASKDDCVACRRKLEASK